MCLDRDCRFRKSPLRPEQDERATFRNAMDTVPYHSSCRQLREEKDRIEALLLCTACPWFDWFLNEMWERERRRKGMSARLYRSFIRNRREWWKVDVIKPQHMHHFLPWHAHSICRTMKTGDIPQLTSTDELSPRKSRQWTRRTSSINRRIAVDIAVVKSWMRPVFLSLYTLCLGELPGLVKIFESHDVGLDVKLSLA